MSAKARDTRKRNRAEENRPLSTFTLAKETKARLDHLSKTTGLSRSVIIDRLVAGDRISA